MPWKKGENGLLAVDEAGNPVWVSESGEEKGADYGQLIESLRKVNAESKTRKEKIRSMEEKYAAFDGIDDLAAFRAEADKAMAQVKTLSEKDRDVDNLIAARVEAVAEGYKKQLAEHEKKNSELENELNRLKVNVCVKDSKMLQRVCPDQRKLMEREMRRAGFVGEDGKVQFRDDDGEVFRNEKYEPCTADEAVLAIMKMLNIDSNKALLSLDTANGSGANGSNGSLPGVKNPWKKETWNVTEQCRLMRDNPAMAQSLMQAAGVTP